MNVVNKKVDPPSLDYTICKLGELKASVSGEFDLKPLDSLDGELQTERHILCSILFRRSSHTNLLANWHLSDFALHLTS